MHFSRWRVYAGTFPVKQGAIMRRVLGIIAVVVLLLVAAIGVALYYSANVVQRVFERAGSHVMRVEVTLREVDLSDVMEGSVGTHGLRIGNPVGFDSAYLMDVDSASTSIETASLTADTLIIRDILIEGPSIIYEYSGGRSNFGEVQRHVNEFIAARSPADPAPAEGRRQIIIENFRLRGARATVTAPQFGREATIDIPPVHLSDLGSETGGITPAEALARIYAELHRHIGAAVAGLGMPEVSEFADRVRRDADAAVREARERAREAAAEAREEVEGGVEERLQDLEDALRRRVD
jgi:hypothetical protein